MYAVTYMIPKDAEKPVDPRKIRKQKRDETVPQVRYLMKNRRREGLYNERLKNGKGHKPIMAYVL